MIRYLKVEGLNNRLDDEFEFNEDLNIFTGANGSGKTTLLKLIWHLISGNLERIMPEIPIRFVSIDTNQFSLEITRSTPEIVNFDCKFVRRENAPSEGATTDFQNVTPEQDDVSLVVIVEPNTGYLEPHENAIKLDELNRRIVLRMSSSLYFPTFRRIEGGVSRSQSITKSSFSSRYVRTRVTDRTMERLQDAMSELSSDVSVYDHKFIASISTNDIAALLTQQFVPISKNIDKLQVDLSKNITGKIDEYFDNEEIVETQNSQIAHVVLEEIQEMVDQVTKEREALLKPFSVLSDITQDILKYQAVHFTGDVVGSEDIEGITLGEGTEGIALGLTKGAISSDKLSSGEKQMLSFLCYNAFYDNTPIFIDEPELSLHVDWQRRLFPTLLEQGRKNQFFVATHSPFIYSKYPDKEFMLDEDRGES